MVKKIWKVTSLILPSLCVVALFVLSMPTPKAKAELQELTATVQQVLTINIPTALNFNVNDVDERWHAIPFQVGISSNNRTGYTFVSDVAASMKNTKYTSKSIKLDEHYTIAYPSGSVKETQTHVNYPNSDNSALDKKYNFNLNVLASSNVTNGTYTGTMSFFATANPYPTTIAYIDYLDQISNDIVLTMTPGKFYQLKDRRDGKKYWIVFENGEVKMAQNLDYDITTSTTLTSSNTNTTNNITFANATITGGTFEESWVESADAPQSYDEGTIYRPSEEDAYTTINACVRDGYSEWECYRSAGGNYYNWSAAVASNDTSTYYENYVASADICPKNWQLPTTSSEGFLSATMPEDKAAAGKIRCEGIKPAHLVHIIVDDHYGHTIEKVKNNTAWGISSFVLPKDFEYTANNSFELAGWSTRAGDVAPTYAKGALFETSAGEITLYAVWRDKPLKLSDITYMQEMSPAIIKNTPDKESKQLIDSRDNKKYWVTKFGNTGSGYIIMTQNLDFDMPTTDYTYRVEDSDVIEDKSFKKVTSLYDFDGGEYYFANGTDKRAIEDFSDDDERWHYHIGNYYSQVNAKIGTADLNGFTNTQYSICPKGWGLPTSKEYNSFQTGSAQNYYVMGGYLYSKDVVSYQGSRGYYVLNDVSGSGYWRYSGSGEQNYTYYTRTYYYYVYSSGSVYSDYGNVYEYGYSVRCIARDDYNVNDPSSRLTQRQNSRN